MSYESALGDTTSWGTWTSSADEVYLWRANLNVAVETPDDLKLFVRAVGTAQNWKMHVRGAVVHPDRRGVDVVLTPREAGCDIAGIPTCFWWHNASTIADRVAAEPNVRARYPGLEISAPETLQLTGPPQSVDFWRAGPTLWDNGLGSDGGPTDAFARGDGLWIGMADDGPMLKKFAVAAPAVVPSASDSSSSMWTWVIGAGVFAAALFAARTWWLR